MKIYLNHLQRYLADVSQNVSQVIHRYRLAVENSICQIGPNCPLCLHGRYRAVDTGGGLQGPGYFANHALEAFQVRPVGSAIRSFFPALYPSAARGIHLSPAENLKRGLA